MRVTVGGTPVDLPGARATTSASTSWSPSSTRRWRGPRRALFGLRDGRVVTLRHGGRSRRQRAVRGAAARAPLDRGRPARPARRRGQQRRPRVLESDRDGVPGAPPRRGDVRTVYAGGTDVLRPAYDLYGQLWLVDRTRPGARRLGGPGRHRAARSTRPGSPARRWSAFVLSRDGTRLVAQVRRGGRDRLLVSRVERDAKGRVARVGPAQALPPRRRRRGPVRGHRLADAGHPGGARRGRRPTTSQVLLVKVDGSSTAASLSTDAELFREPGHPAGDLPGAGHPAAARHRRRPAAAGSPGPAGGRGPRSSPAWVRRPSSAERPVRVHRRSTGSGVPSRAGGPPAWRRARGAAVARARVPPRRRPRPAARQRLRRAAPAGAGAVPGLRRRAAAARPAGLADARRRPAWPRRSPPATYDGLLKALVNGHKEHGVLALRRRRSAGCWATWCGDLLARRSRGREPGRCCWCRCPSRPAGRPAARARPAAARGPGGPPAAAQRTGCGARVARLLVPAGRVRDQAALDAAAAGRQPGRLDALPPGRAPAARRAARRGGRRRAHHRLDRPRGAAGARRRSGCPSPASRWSRRPGEAPRLDRDATGEPDSWGSLPLCTTGATNVCVWSPSGSVVASAECCARTEPVSDRRRPVATPPASRCQSQAKRST